MTDRSAIIREAVEEDLPAIVGLLAEDPIAAERESLIDPLPFAYRAAFAEISADSRQTLLVAEMDGVVVGTLQLSIIPNLTYEGRRRAQVEGVRIAMDRRGRGVGRHLMERAKEMAVEAGCHILQLTTNRQRPQALHFYERLGFVDSHHGLKLYLQD
ncbi:MAG: GNAT family N-acetyltransferase [Gammaproteobacteria bacterium]|jgi:GNAT superfamily N-acetyltransferase|nr:MAG: GNAT family N-acetyltransferase [Gammaproteobacteria bacterium]